MKWEGFSKVKYLDLIYLESRYIILILQLLVLIMGPHLWWDIELPRDQLVHFIQHQARLNWAPNVVYVKC